MKTEILEQKKNPFLEREEFTLEIKNEVAPSLDEVKTELKKDADLTIVKKVHTNFGKQIFKVEAVVYDNKEAMKKVETIPVKVRKKMEADEKAAAEAAKKAEAETKAAEETKEETPTEEPTPKEETKEETPAENQEPTTKNQEQNQDN